MEYAISNVDWIETGVKLALGFLGIAAYVVWKVRTHLANFKLGKLIQENKSFWIWSLAMILIVILILTISPQTSEAIKTMIGLDVSGEPSSFLLLGWSLSALSNEISKKSLNRSEGQK